ncbi:MAG: YeaC family protein [OM182 bacterium]|nr:YeaC family protein [OM182 bacterium]
MSEKIPEIPFDKPESIDALVDAMTPTIYENLKTAVELGKWGDGTRLSAEQVESCLQAIILYETKNLPESERIDSSIPTGCSSTLQ